MRWCIIEPDRHCIHTAAAAIRVRHSVFLIFRHLNMRRTHAMLCVLCMWFIVHRFSHCTIYQAHGIWYGAKQSRVARSCVYRETAHGFVIMMSRKYFDNQRRMKNAIHLQNAASKSGTLFSRHSCIPHSLSRHRFTYMFYFNWVPSYRHVYTDVKMSFHYSWSVFLTFICKCVRHAHVTLTHIVILSSIFIHMLDSSTKMLNQTLIDFELTPFNLVKWA